MVNAAIFSVIDQTFFDQRLITKILYNPFSLSLQDKLKPPNANHLLGTDLLGRDLLARIIYGARVALEIGLLAVGISGFVGTILGLIAGYYGGVADSIIMRIADVLLAFPAILLALAFVTFAGPGLTNVVIALSLRSWVSYARIIRGQVLKIKIEEYALAAIAIGCSNLRIMVRYILPNALSPLIVQATMGLGGMIISAAGLSFLGLGVMPPTPSWGMMLNEGRLYIRTAWWLSVSPGIAIFITVMGFNLVGDFLRDVLDPRLRNVR